MLTLVTGMPGAGKTSNTLWAFLQDTSGRPKFVTPISGFDPIAHGVGELDSLEHWPDLPDGSIVLVDEAQTFLRPNHGKTVPGWLADFETHRHRGFDFFLITQHPGLISSHVRKLVQKHVHYHRPWNLKTATRYEWEQIQPNPDLPTARKTGLSKRIQPNKAVFDVYNSTVLDTHKAKLPWKWIITLVVALLIIAVIAAGFLQWKRSLSPVPGQVQNAVPGQVQNAVPGQVQNAVPGQVQNAVPGQVDKKAITINDLLPAVSGLAWTAPIYANITEPTDFPRIAACMSSARSGCTCYTQQATPIDVAPAVCGAMVSRGTFDPWKSGRVDVPGLANTPPVKRAEARQDFWSDPIAGGSLPLPSETFIPRS